MPWFRDARPLISGLTACSSGHRARQEQVTGSEAGMSGACLGKASTAVGWRGGAEERPERQVEAREEARSGGKGGPRRGLGSSREPASARSGEAAHLLSPPGLAFGEIALAFGKVAGSLTTSCAARDVTPFSRSLPPLARSLRVSLSPTLALSPPIPRSLLLPPPLVLSRWVRAWMWRPLPAPSAFSLLLSTTRSLVA